MAENKKSFVAYADWMESFEMLEDAEAGKLIKHLLRYVNDLNPEMDDRLLKIAFQPMKAQLKRDLNKYDEVRKKRAEAGKKGGKITQNKAKQANVKSDNQKKANQAVNDTVIVNDIDTDTKKENIEKQKRFSAPSKEEVFNKMLEKDLTESQAKNESEKFWSFYDSKNWMVGKNKMKKWESAVSGWITRSKEFNQTHNPQGAPKLKFATNR